VQLADATTYAIPVPVRKLVAQLTNGQAD